jgi:hypothetical protein
VARKLDPLTVNIICLFYDMTLFYRVSPGPGDWTPVCRYVDDIEEDD